MEQDTNSKYIKALMNISRAITSDLFLEDLLKLIVMVTAKVMDVDICSLWLINQEVDPPVMTLKATQAIEPEYIKDRTLNLNEGVVGHIVTTNQPLVIDQVLESDKFKEKEMAKRLGLVSMVGVPLQSKSDKAIGVLNCFTSEIHKFSETEINLLQAVANQAAVAILNTELMVQTKVIQEELETRKLLERAKEILMYRKKMTGNEAYRWLQKKSMNTRKSMRQVAEAVLFSEELHFTED